MCYWLHQVQVSYKTNIQIILHLFQALLFNRSSPMKIVRLCKKMTPDQRNLVIGADFGDILGMKCSKLIPELCRYLISCFDPSSCALDFGYRGRIPITDESVCKVMGVPMGSTTVSYHLDVEATRFILQKFGIQYGKPPTMASLELQLAPNQPADDVYLTKFILYLMNSVFAPTTGIRASPRCYPSLLNIKGVKDLNWARFIIYILIKTANAKDMKNWFKACMPYLMVCNFYFLHVACLIIIWIPNFYGSAVTTC